MITHLAIRMSSIVHNISSSSVNGVTVLMMKTIDTGRLVGISSERCCVGRRVDAGSRLLLSTELKRDAL